MFKTCIKCNESKALEMFAKASRYADGRRNYCKQCHSKYVTQYVKENPSKRSKQDPKRKFKRHGLSEEKFNSIFNKFDGMCHSCKTRSGLNIDHDHNCCPGTYSCGNCVRGVLCMQCNTALGLLDDNKEKIKNLIKYLK